MPTWIIEPRDPLIARDGRPFTNEGGSRATSLPFPPPSIIAGTMRTLYGYSKPDFTTFDSDLISEVKNIGVIGPLLVKLSESGEPEQWLAPAPADAVLFDNEKGGAIIRQLCPKNNKDNFETDLPEDLTPIRFKRHDDITKGKSVKEVPHFWNQKEFENWLINPEEKEIVELNTFGHSGPIYESRTHTAIDVDTQSASESLLYQTRGLEFSHHDKDKEIKTRYALAAHADIELVQRVAPLGGEQRLSYWRKSEKQLFNSCPEKIIESITQNKICRVLLLTPAYFKDGWRPSWLFEERDGMKAELIGAAVGRPLTISGWELASPTPHPKPTRRLAPAGSVYFLKLEGDGDIKNWINHIWMKCISDDNQLCLDGFGLAVIGTLQNLE